MLTVGGAIQLYSINLVNGHGTLIGDFLDGITPASGLAIQNAPDDDLDGNGLSDIVWQSDAGTAAAWLMNGSNATFVGAVGPNPGPSWEIKGTGDFNGDGKSDIIWQGDDGTASMWLMDGTSATFVGAVGPFSPGADWDIVI